MTHVLLLDFRLFDFVIFDLLLFTARKRSLGQGNIFGNVSFCSQVRAYISCHFLSRCLVPCSLWRGLCLWSHVPSSRRSLSKGISVWRVSPSRGWLCLWGLCPWGLCPRGLPNRNPLDRDPHGQRPPDRDPLDKYFWTETPTGWRHPPDRDPLGQRPPPRRNMARVGGMNPTRMTSYLHIILKSSVSLKSQFCWQNSI